MIDREQLHRDGYALLRGAIPAAWLEELRAAFDRGVKPSNEWPVPRGPGWRHSLLDLEPQVQAVCHLPEMLAVAGALIGERFFLAQVEGREPLADGGHQTLHRDLSKERPGDSVSALAYFDDYGPGNGATRIVPGSHRPAPEEPPFDFRDESRSVQLSGSAGDILVFDADLVHAASRNPSGARRRTILIGYFAEPCTASHLATAHLRSIRMDTTGRFDPSGLAVEGAAQQSLNPPRGRRFTGRACRVCRLTMRWCRDKLEPSMSAMITTLTTCSCCDATPLAGFENCRAMFNAVLEREYRDPAFGQAHLLTVDAFCLQHSEQCGPRSNAFHLMRLCWLLEHGGNPSIRQVRGEDRAFRQAREESLRHFPFLEPPAVRGALTVVSILEASAAEEHTERVRAWARDVWEAWSEHHPWAREQATRWFDRH